MPSLKKYFLDLNHNMKQTLNLYLTSIGKDPQKIWKKMEDAISNVYIEKEKQMYKLTKERFSTTRYFKIILKTNQINLVIFSLIYFLDTFLNWFVLIFF